MESVFLVIKEAVSEAQAAVFFPSAWNWPVHFWPVIYTCNFFPLRKTLLKTLRWSAMIQESQNLRITQKQDSDSLWKQIILAYQIVSSPKEKWGRKQQ